MIISVCAVWEKVPNEGFRLLEHHAALPQLDPIFSRGDFWKKQSRRDMLWAVFSTTNRSWGALFQPLPTRYILAPMIYGGEVRGILHVEEQKSYLYTETDQKLVSLVAENLAVALEHARTVQELENAQEYLLNILTNSHIAIIVTDEHNRAQIFNEGATQLSGYEEKEMQGTPISRCFHPDDYRMIRRLLIRKGKIEDWETEIITAQGELLPISFIGLHASG